MSKVFVSYSHHDKSEAQSICKILSELSQEFFEYEASIKWGDSITSEVGNGIRASSVLMPILSNASVQSHWVAYEIGYASALGKRILPYVLSPFPDIPLFMKDIRCATTHEEIKAFFNGIADPIAPLIANSESRKASELEKASKMLPDLLGAMQLDFQSADNKFLREVLILPTRGVVYNSSRKRLVYYETELSNLVEKFELLNRLGLVQLVKLGSDGYTRIYELSEDLVEHIAPGQSVL